MHDASFFSTDNKTATAYGSAFTYPIILSSTCDAILAPCNAIRNRWLQFSPAQPSPAQPSPTLLSPAGAGPVDL